MGRKKECLASLVGGGEEARSAWEAGSERGAMCAM